jgi:endonuclease YncB( thermonuclease family)
LLKKLTVAYNGFRIDDCEILNKKRLSMYKAIPLMALLLIFILPISSPAASQRKKIKKIGQENKTQTAVEKREPVGPLIVSRVISGDLLELTSGERVRLMGADAPVMPERNNPGQEPWAGEARLFTERLTLGKEITIKNFGLAADEYGRRAGLVYIGETCVDYELIKQGLAVVQTNRYLDHQSRQLMLEAQREARTGDRGIWNSANPISQPPHEFRAANNLSEGNNSKSDSWKKAIIPVEPSLDIKQNSRTPTGSSGSIVNKSTQGGATADTENQSGIQAARETIEALMQLQARINGGIKSSELSRLLSTAQQRFDSMMNGPVDRILARDLKDSLDAYLLTLEAFKRREAASSQDAARFTKYIDGALEIAEKSLASAIQRLKTLSR